MEKFLKNLWTFSLYPTIACIASFYIFTKIVNEKSSRSIVSKKVHTVFIGDSHIEQAIDDSILKNSINLGASCEALYFSYYKLKNLLEHNNSIYKVYLGIGYHSLSNYYNRFIYGDESVIIAPIYYYLLPIKEKSKLVYHNRNKLTSLTKTIIKEGIQIIQNPKKGNYIGGFNNTFNKTKAQISFMDDRLDYQYYQTKQTLFEFSKSNELALKNIIQLCKDKNIELIGLLTPTHKYYFNKIPTSHKQKLKNFIQQSGIQTIDLSQLDLKEDNYLPDGDHLSKKGATTITIYLKNLTGK